MSTKDEVLKLNVIQGMEETNRKGFEQYDSLLKEYEKVKKEKAKQEKEYEPNVTLELTKFIRKMLSF